MCTYKNVGFAVLCLLGCLIVPVSAHGAGENESSLLASTYIGGAAEADYPYSMAIDASGNVYIAGYTRSSDFPATEGAFSTSLGGSYDAFIAKFDGSLKSLLAATLYGGEGGDQARSIVIDSDGTVYITGITGSDDLPTTAGAFQPEHRVGRVGTDAFVARFDPDLKTLLAATYLSGSDGGAEDEAYAIAVSSAAHVYVTGYTDAPNFPVTPGAYDTDHGADPDAINPGGKLFVVKLDAELQTMLAGTFLGTQQGAESAYALVVDEDEKVYIGGSTSAAAFPVTPGAYDTTFNNGSGKSDIFIARFNAGLSILEACTFIGGSESDTMGYDTPQQTDKSLVIDGDGNVYITGTTYSLDFPVTEGAFMTVRDYGGTFVSKLDPDLTQLLASTYLCNGSSRSIALDSAGTVCVAGDSEYGCPVPQNAYQTEEDQWGSIYVIRLDPALENMLGATFLGGSERESALSIAVDSDDNLYLTGKTASPDFPVTAGAYDTSFNSTEDDYDGFVVTFDSDLTGDRNDTPTGGDCPFETTLDDIRVLKVLRSIRDNRLSHGTATACVTSYYSNSRELSAMLVANPLLRRRLQTFIGSHRKELAAYASQGSVSITSETAAAVTALLEELKPHASVQLVQALDRWLEKLADREFLFSIGITIHR